MYCFRKRRMKRIEWKILTGENILLRAYRETLFGVKRQRWSHPSARQPIHIRRRGLQRRPAQISLCWMQTNSDPTGDRSGPRKRQRMNSSSCSDSRGVSIIIRPWWRWKSVYSSVIFVFLSLSFSLSTSDQCNLFDSLSFILFNFHIACVFWIELNFFSFKLTGRRQEGIVSLISLQKEQANGACMG